MDLTTGGRDYLYDLMREQVVSGEHVVNMICKWMTDDDIMNMLDANELSPRFLREEQDDDN